MALRRITSISLIALCALIILNGCSGSWVKEEIEIGYKGRAKIDPFLAASRFLTKLGIPSESHFALPQMPPDNTLLITTASNFNSTVSLESISDWMHHGGHLICFLQRDQEGSTWKTSDLPIELFLDFFELELNLSRKKDALLVTEVTYTPSSGITQNYETDFYSHVQSKGYKEKDYSLHNRFDYGQGSLTIWSTAAPFTNESLQKAQHALLLKDLVQLYDPEAIWLAFSTTPSFWILLWEYGSPLIIASALLLILFIWWKSKRFGPTLKTINVQQLKLDDLLTSTGAFLSKHKADQLIVAELQQALLLSLTRKVNLPLNAERSQILHASVLNKVITIEERSLFEPIPTSTSEDRLLYFQQLQVLQEKLL